MKGRIIILMFPERGALNSSFMLAKQLTIEGFEILYLTNSSFIKHVREQGFNCELFDLSPFYKELCSRLNSKSIETPWLSRKLEWVKIFFKRNDLLEEYLETNLGEFLEQPVSLVLLDPIMMNCCIPIIKRNIPVVHLNTTFAYRINGKCFPVFSWGVPLNQKGLFSRIKVLTTWVLLWFRIIRKDLAWHRKHGLVPTRTINTAKKKIRQIGHQYVWGEYGYRLKCPELVLASRELDFKTIADDHRRCYVGASVFRGRNDGRYTSYFCEKPLLYCSLGTYGHLCKYDVRLFYAVIKMMRGLPEWDAIIQMKERLATNVQIPPNVRVMPLVPQLEILEKASVAITHAGCSSLKECIITGTPMIVLPWNNDGAGNGARVVYHSLGVRLDIASISAELLRDALVQLTTDTRILSAIKSMQEVFLSQEDCKNGVEFINEFLQQRNAS